jgi:hypothetical protein
MRTTRALPIALSLLAASCLEVGNNQLTVTIEDGAPFYADGESFRTVTVALPADTDPGKPITVTTSLGLVDVTSASGDNARRTRTLYTTAQGGALAFKLFAEWQSGAGEVLVEAPGTGLRGVASFTLLPVEDVLTIDVDPPQPVAGGLAQVTVRMGSQATRPRDVSLVASHGALALAKVKVSPAASATVTWEVGAEPASATITATVDPGGAIGRQVIAIQPAADLVTVEVAPGTYLADGNSLIPLAVTRSSSLSDRVDVVVQATHGVLNPAASGEARKQRTIGLRGNESVQVSLYAGRDPGQVLVTAALPDRAPAATSFELAVAPPTLMGIELAAAPIFDRERQQLGATAVFARGAGQGLPSIGTRVFFTTCCDDGGGRGECSEYLSVPLFDTPAGAADEVDLVVRLTAAGETFVNQTGTPPADDLLVRLYAFALEAGFAGALPSCAALDAGFPSGVAVMSFADLALRKSAR